MHGKVLVKQNLKKRCCFASYFRNKFCRLSIKVWHHQAINHIDINSITVGEFFVNTKPVVRNLGSSFDSQLSISTHISKLCSLAFFHLLNISRTVSLETCFKACLLRSALQPYYTTDVLAKLASVKEAPSF